MSEERETSREEREIFAPDARTEVREELDFHLAMLTREYVARGLTPVQAREAALRRFGDIERLRGECRVLAEERDRTMRRSELLSELWYDVRYALRQLRRAPGFTIAAVLTLALGIGATSAIFGAVDAVLLRPLPLPAADRLVVPQSQSLKEDDDWNITYADYEDWRAANVFESVALFQRINVNVASEVDAERVSAIVATQDFFRVLRIAPILGSTFRPDEFAAGMPYRVVLSHGLWVRRFGADTAIIGKMVHIAGLPREVAAVLPEGLSYPAGAEAWLALQVSPEANENRLRRDNFIYEGIARLAPGKTHAQTGTELATLAQRVSAAEPTIRGDVTVKITPLSELIVGETATRTLWILFAAVGMVLLIACVNVANLLLSRAAVRTRELVIRTGLGATRGRIARQLITEALVLSLIAGGLGVFLAVGAVRVMVATAPAEVPRVDTISVNANVLAFAFGAALFCALLFGVLPALRAARTAISASLATASTRTTSGVASRRGRRTLVVAELALALMLLIGASLLLRSFFQLRGTDPGLDKQNLLTFAVNLQGERYLTMPRPLAYREMSARLAALPGVSDVAFVSSLPLGGGGFYLGRVFLYEGQPEPPASEDTNAMWVSVTPGYFKTTGIPLLQGRDFVAADDENATQVMIVSREFARRMFGDANPIGRRVRSWRDENVYREIVGVAGDSRIFGVLEDEEPIVYVPHGQDARGSMASVIRTTVPPHTLAEAVRRTVREFDPKLGVAEIQSMDDIFSDSMATTRFSTLLLGGFAGLALLLALIGVYGVLSYDVTQRTREIGIRMALGARKSEVVALVLRDAGLVVVTGIALGIAGAWATAKYVRYLLHDVSATDPLTFAVVAALLAVVALAASLVPGRRAAGVDPMRALRAD